MSGVCWFREKTPFLVYLEVLQASGNMDKEMEDLFSEGEDNQSDLSEPGNDLDGDSGFASDVEPEHSDADGHTPTFSLEEETDPLGSPDTMGAGEHELLRSLSCFAPFAALMPPSFRSACHCNTVALCCVGYAIGFGYANDCVLRDAHGLRPVDVRAL